MEDSIKSKLSGLLDRADRDEENREKLALQKRKASERFRLDFERAVNGTIIPAADELKLALEPNGWHLHVRGDAHSAQIEIEKNNLRGANGGLPRIEFNADDETATVFIYRTTTSAAGATMRGLTTAQLTPKMVQEHIVDLLEKLVAEISQ